VIPDSLYIPSTSPWLSITSVQLFNTNGTEQIKQSIKL